jgi:hypothetical protein
MITIRDLLDRIRWDREYRRGSFRLLRPDRKADHRRPAGEGRIRSGRPALVPAGKHCRRAALHPAAPGVRGVPQRRAHLAPRAVPPAAERRLRDITHLSRRSSVASCRRPPRSSVPSRIRLRRDQVCRKGCHVLTPSWAWSFIFMDDLYTKGVGWNFGI